MPPHTYVAGLFDTLGTKPAIPELVPAADWLKVRISLSGRPLVHHPGDASAHHMTLDLRRGALLAESGLLKAPGVGIRMHTLRLVSISERAVGLQLIQLEVEEGESRSHSKRRLRVSISGSSLNGSIRISACGAPNVPARASPWPPHRRCKSMATIFRRPPSTN